MTKRLKIALIAIFAGAFVLLIFSARTNAQTTDEAIHLFAGYTYLTRGDFRLDPEHPPFLKELSAIPLLFVKNIHVEYDDLWQSAGVFYYDSWQETRALGDRFFYGWGNNPNQLLFLGRLMTIYLTLILGFFSFFWARKLYGDKAGVLAVFLVLFFPNFLAHGALINTDLGLTLFIFMAVYFWGEFLKFDGGEMDWVYLISAGVFSGLAMVSKFTAIILFLILLALTIVKYIVDKKHLDRMITGYLIIIVMTFVIVWASYGFSLAVIPKPAVSLSSELTNWAKYNVPKTYDGFFETTRPVLVPAYFYKGFIMVTRHAMAGHGSYLLGMHSNSGWWYYFPVTILFKTPIPVFILLTLAIIYRQKLKTKNTFDEWILLAPPVIYLLLSINSKADLGVRHILPIFPFILVYIARTANLINFSKMKIVSGIIVAALVWYLSSTLISFPNYLAYFNELAGGPKGGHKVLTDSNLDWGQDIYRIKNYLNQNNIQISYLVYPWDGGEALNYYGLNYPELKPEMSADQNAKGKVIISATYYETEAYAWLKPYPMEQITPGVFLVTIN